MTRAKPEAPLPPSETPADRAMAQAREAGELRHLEFVATLDPRERERLAPWAVLMEGQNPLSWD